MGREKADKTSGSHGSLRRVASDIKSRWLRIIRADAAGCKTSILRRKSREKKFFPLLDRRI
jgi:hypothetical protein